MQTRTMIKTAGGKRIRSASDEGSHGTRVTPASARATGNKKPSNGKVAIASAPATTSKPGSRYSVGMFSPGEARCDRWQELAHAAQTVVARAAAGSSTEETLATIKELLKPLSVLETFRAFPGEAMMGVLKEALARD